MNEIELIYIGDEFYMKSGTMMSAIYIKEGKRYDRYDWGFVNRDLRSGKSVTIRPATEEEMVPFLLRLEELKRRRERTG